MSALLRSKQGCWTCRLRKKKCDEGSPHCLVCESLSITCYGYGQKPDWMSNDEKARAVANSLKEIVKQTSRRKGTVKAAKQGEAVAMLAPKRNSLDGFVETATPGSSQTKEHGGQELHSTAEVDSAELGSSEPWSKSMLAVPPDESDLLMSFLDNVFRLQYPMYKPGAETGGRGWLLFLLLRSKSLYHVALALGAFYRRNATPETTSHPLRVAALVQQEKHLQTTFASIKESASSCCEINGLGMAITVTQLLFLELFVGHNNAWQPHLSAATTMFLRGYKDDLSKFGLSGISPKILLDDDPLSDLEPVISQEVVSFRFLAGTVIWLDVTASITLGTAPKLLLFHSRVLSSSSQIKLEDIMGCQNWVVLQIGRIVMLQHQITQQQGQHSDCAEFERSAKDILRELQNGLNQVALEGFSISEPGSSAMANKQSDQSALVTHVFASMAFVYLHLITYGFLNLERLETLLSGSMEILRSQVPTTLLPALVLPLFVIGSVAKKGDQQFFHYIFSSWPLVDPLLKHREALLPIMEEIWRRRETITDLAWRDIFDLTQDILLI